MLSSIAILSIMSINSTFSIDSACAQLLVITLEKEQHSISTKFDFWRSAVKGHPEVDTHMIKRDDAPGKENALPAFSTEVLRRAGVEGLLKDRMGKMKFR